MKPILRILFVLVMLTALGAHGSDPVREKGTGPANVPKDPTNLSVDPVLYQNENDEFQILFPGGCAKLVTRQNEPDLFGGEEWSDFVQISHVYCDRWQKEGEGCFVMATYNLRKADGSMAGPDNVIIGIQGILEEYGVKVVNQEVIRKDFGDGIIAEGVDVFAGREMESGEFWVRGLLINGDIYILAAWNQEGNVWKNADYITFFNSFLPWTE